MKATFIALILAFLVALAGLIALIVAIPPYDCTQIEETNLRESCIKDQQTK